VILVDPLNLDRRVALPHNPVGVLRIPLNGKRTDLLPARAVFNRVLSHPDTVQHKYPASSPQVLPHSDRNRKLNSPRRLITTTNSSHVRNKLQNNPRRVNGPAAVANGIAEEAFLGSKS